MCPPDRMKESPTRSANTVAGRTDYMMALMQLALVEIRGGRLRPLGVSTMKRSSLVPSVPTIAEAGIAGFDYPIWYGVWTRLLALLREWWINWPKDIARALKHRICARVDCEAWGLIR